MSPVAPVTKMVPVFMACSSGDEPRHAVVRLDDGTSVAYRDVRRFGTWLLLEPDEVEAYVDARVGRELIAERRLTTLIGPGGDLRFTVPVTLGGTSEEATFSGTLTGNLMRGSVQIVGHPNGTFVGTRPAAGGQGGRGGQRVE